MIALENISKGYGGRVLFRDLSLSVGDEERVALVGPNGAGKSTLMKIITGEVESDDGRVVPSRANTVGYLPQDGVNHRGRSLFQEAAAAFDDLMAMHSRVEKIAGELESLRVSGRGSPREAEELAHELGRIQHHLEHREAYSIESRVEQVLFGLGFKGRDLPRPTGEFSGGWQMRIALAKLLLREPTILMLDEPTNHLDIDSLDWLEQQLKGYEGSVLVISHDSRFLDNLVRRTIEISGGRVTEYAGNYSWYLEEKDRRTEILEARRRNQEQSRKQAKRFVERFRYKATKARQVQSRLKMLDRMEVTEQESEEAGISFDFPAPHRAGRNLVSLEGVGKRYGDNQVFRGVSLTLDRGDRAAFLGPNGAGKSTLARIIAGVETFQEGTRVTGHNVTISYYAQHQAEELVPGLTVLETLEETASAETQTRLRTLLGCFLFSGDDVFKKVSVLSGGERSRLALAKMLITPASLLVLDEPTNHLDRRSKMVLQGALQRFPGSFVVVSHDRDFLAPLVNRVVELREGMVAFYPGSVDDYLDRLHRLSQGEREERAGASGPRQARSGSVRLAKEKKRREAEERQRKSRLLGPLCREAARRESDIVRLEGRKETIEKELASPEVCAEPGRARSLSVEYHQVTTELAYLFDEWARLQEEIEEVEPDDGCSPATPGA